MSLFPHGCPHGAVYSNYVYEQTGADLLPVPSLCLVLLTHLFCLEKKGRKNLLLKPRLIVVHLVLRIMSEARTADPHSAIEQESCLIAAQLSMFHLVTFCQCPLRAICCLRVLISIKCNIKYKYCTSLLCSHHFH